MLAQRGEGRVLPNPSVGCVIVKDGRLVGQGRTANGGRPHAETQALAEAGMLAKGATVYVTLEPCSHHGKTPPCADALIQADVGHVIIAAGDPDDRVAGQGKARLVDAGIRVSTGLMEDAATDMLAGYFLTRKRNRPLVTVKLATSLDGRIGLADGTSQWITGALIRRYVHEMRSRHDAVMTSTGTLKADNPMLTSRLDGIAHQPLRVLVSGHAVLEAHHNLATTLDQGPVLCLCPEQVMSDIPTGVEAKAVPTNSAGKPDLHAVLATLAGRGVTSVMVEAGGQFVAALMAEQLIDRLIWMRSSSIIGGDGRASLADLGLNDLAAGRIFKRKSLSLIGDDVIEVLHHHTGEN